MKKIILFTTVILMSTQLFSKVWTVRATGGDFLSLATAVANTNAAKLLVSGDTLDVLGTFVTGKVAGTATTPKVLTIIGHGVDQTILQYAAIQPTTAVSSTAVFYFDGDFSNSNITIKDLTIQNVNCSSNGGGIRFNNSGASNATLNLSGLKINNNIALNGGGAFIQGRTIATINNCYITGNTSTGTGNGGGGLAFVPVLVGVPINATIKNSTIANNISSGIGGAGIAVFSRGTASLPSSLWIENSTIYGNSSTSSAKSGGGIYVKNVEGSAPFTLTLNHCTIAGNTTNAGVGGDGLCIDNNSATTTTLVMNNTLVMGNSGSTSNVSQVGINAPSPTSANITNGGINNSIFSILSGATWFPKTGVNNNNNITGTANLAFATGLSTDAIPVLKTGSGSLARDYVTTNYLTPALLTDAIGNPRVGYADAGAFENPNAGLAVAATVPTGGYIVSGVGTYDSGSSASLIAAANAGYKFVNWTENGTEVGTALTYTINSVTAAHNLVANFVTKDFLIAISATTGGTVSGGNYFNAGETATVTATASTGYSFVNWTENGTEVSTLASYAFTVSGVRTLVANFEVANAVAQVKEDNFVIVRAKTLTFPSVSGVIEVFNTVGKLEAYSKSTENSITLKNNGIYIVKMTSKEGVKVQKVLIN